MQAVIELVSKLQKLRAELRQADQETERWRSKPNPTPRSQYAGLDLAWFDLSDPDTRSQLLTAESNPEPIPSDIRFESLIKGLLIDIRAAKVYLQHDAYPQAKAWGARVPKLEAAIAQLEKRSEKADIQATFYLDDKFLEDGGEDFCWRCANEIISRVRSALLFSCLLLCRRYFRLAYSLWVICEDENWWDMCWHEVSPHETSQEEWDGTQCCDRCYITLSYSLSKYGVDEEADYFLEKDKDTEMTPEHWYQLERVFEGAKEQDWPNYLADKLERLIEKYQLTPEPDLS